MNSSVQKREILRRRQNGKLPGSQSAITWTVFALLGILWLGAGLPTC
jgi:hypothetical protein